MLTVDDPSAIRVRRAATGMISSGKLARRLRGGRPGVAAEGPRVLVVARDALAPGDLLRGETHVEEDLRPALGQAGVGGEVPADHGHEAHRFEAAPTATSVVPLATDWLANASACRPEAQKRLTVMALVATGRPAPSAT